MLDVMAALRWSITAVHPHPRPFGACLASSNPSMKESTKGGGRRRRPPPFVEAARSAATFMDGFVAAKEAADAAETHADVCKTCTCMHTLRETSVPHEHHRLLAGKRQAKVSHGKRQAKVAVTARIVPSTLTIEGPASVWTLTWKATTHPSIKECTKHSEGSHLLYAQRLLGGASG